MTGSEKRNGNEGADTRPSLLPFDPRDLVAMRVLPAEFARMVGVSRQTVSRWLREGKIHAGPDGKVDPSKAARDVIRNSDPGRLRARVFREAVATRAELQARADKLQAALRDAEATATARERAAEFRERDNAAHALCRCLDAIEARFAEAVAAHAAGTLDEWMDEVAAVEFYGADLAEYRAEWAADAAAGCPGVPAQSGE